MQQLIVRGWSITEDPLVILEKVRDTCRTGKLSFFGISGTGIKVTCPFHADGHEHNPSAYINLTSNTAPYLWFHCFTDNISCPFTTFIGACFNKSGEWGEDWLISNYGVEEVNQSILNLEEISFNKQSQTSKNISEDVLKDFSNYHPYMDQRHLKKDIINKFDIKYDPLTKCLVFPVRGLDGKIKFLTRRSVESKKFIIDKDADKSEIYLLNEVINNNIKSVVVVEAQISALTLWGWEIPAIALFGAGTSKDQIDALNKTNIRRYILCYDNDDAGKKGQNRFINLINSDVFIDIVQMPKGKDPNDLSENEFRDILKSQNIDL